MPLQPGTTLHNGSYRVIRFLGQGGFGCTYEVEHVIMGRRMAMKEFFVKTMCNRDITGAVSFGVTSQGDIMSKLRQKFIAEARAVNALNHPNIVRVTDVFEENGTAYFVMDYIEGESLQNKLEKRGALSEAEALSYINNVCDAVEYVHAKNILHLDIKPDNIMLDKDGRAILIDFGVAKQYDEVNGQNTSTIVSQSIGFSPLEQVGNKIRNFTPATDIYAIGATLYALLTGKAPIDSADLAGGDTLEPLPPYISQNVSNAIAKAMMPKPKDRPQNIVEFRQLLRGGASGAAASMPSGVKDVPTREYDRPKRNNQAVNNQMAAPQAENKSKRSWVVWAVIATVAAIVAAVAFIFWQKPDNPDAIKSPDTNADLTALVASATANAQNSASHSGSEGLDGQVQVDSTMARLALSCNVANAAITIDNQKYTVSQLAGQELQLTPGVHILRATSQGYADYEKSVRLSAGQTMEYKIVMTKQASVQPMQSTSQSASSATTGTYSGHEWVNLGLPSGLKWATCNVGASSPSDRGTYFGWGETAPKAEYYSSNSQTYAKSMEWLKDNGYLNGAGNLNKSHDAAKKNWGNSWRMPTKAEFNELIANTTCEWTTQNGVYGCKLTSKKNGQSIFFPACGWYLGAALYKNKDGGYYWSSTPNADDYKAYFFNAQKGGCSIGANDRFDGQLIRAVVDK